MIRLTLSVFSFCLANLVSAQSSDFIILKKNSKSIRTFFAGSNISFITTAGVFRDGRIIMIKNDSIVIQEFLVQKIPTTMGTYMLDTAGSFRYAYNYNEIKKIRGISAKEI